MVSDSVLYADQQTATGPHDIIDRLQSTLLSSPRRHRLDRRTEPFQHAYHDHHIKEPLLEGWICNIALYYAHVFQSLLFLDLFREKQLFQGLVRRVHAAAGKPLCDLSRKVPPTRTHIENPFALLDRKNREKERTVLVGYVS